MPRPSISFVVPTRNRREALERNLKALRTRLGGGDEIIVIDNASTDGTADMAARMEGVRLVALRSNLSAAARNVGASAAAGDILFMLDDDSHPADGTIERVRAAFADNAAAGGRLAAVACRIRLSSPPDRHDAGGLAGVFVNCGAAIRRDVFLEAGGYPIDFDYYAEEYDLCCRLWRAGWHVRPLPTAVVVHERSPVNRDAGRMVERLVRNNLRVWDRFAPDEFRERMRSETLDRYRWIAEREGAIAGFEQGLRRRESERRGTSERRMPLSVEQFEDMFGLPLARRRLARIRDRLAIRRVAVLGRGKGCPQLLDVLADTRLDVAGVLEPQPPMAEWCGRPLLPAERLECETFDAIVPGTLSLGVAEDQAQELRVRFPGTPIVAAIDWSSLHQHDAGAKSGAGPASPAGRRPA